MEKTITIKYDAIVKASLKSGDAAASLSYTAVVPYGPPPAKDAKDQVQKTVSVINDNLPPEVIKPVTDALKGVLDWIAKQESSFDDVMVKVNEAASVARRDVPPTIKEPAKK